MVPLSLPSVDLWCCTGFCWLFVQLHLTHNNQGNCNLVNLVVMWLQIFSQLFSHVCVIRYRVLLPDVGSYSSHTLDPEQQSLLQECGVSLHVEFEAMCEDEWKHNITIASDHSEHSDVNWGFDFHLYWYILSSCQQEFNIWYR